MAEVVGGSVVSKVVDLLFGSAIKRINYIWNYSQNLEKFNKELLDLIDMRGRVQQQIDLADSKGDKLVYGVQGWVEMVSTEISTSESFLKDEANAKKTCFKFGMCGNWLNLYRDGKMATKKASSLQELKTRGSRYESCVFVETPAPGILDVYTKKDLDEILTHKSVLEKVIAAIEDENIQIIGIYGSGGVGKTTLAKEVALKMKNHFADIAFTTVSKAVNVDKVKKDIEKATKKIMLLKKKILIILDDVCEKLDLEGLCIPCGIKYKNCKILLTSRNEDVCNKMNCESKICVDPLKEDETWILFKRVVGERIDTDVTLIPVAIKVAEECRGLPHLIEVIGNSLKNKDINEWESDLTKLKTRASDIDPDIMKAFTHLNLSYDYLHSEDVTSYLLLYNYFKIFIMYVKRKKVAMAEVVAVYLFGKVVNSLFGVAKKEISYIWNCAEKVEKFKNEAKKLKGTRDRVQQQINIAKHKGDNLLVGVEQWMDEANHELSEAEVFLEQEEIARKTGFKLLLCGNWVTLYRNGKMATRKAFTLLQHQEGGKTFESCVSVETRAPRQLETHEPGRLDVYQHKNLDDIKTQKLALEKVITAIEDESIQIIGIYGIGGVGKTTLAKEVASKMKNHFADFAFTTVSQTVNVDKVKKDIENATKQIMQGKKILIILDDVWEKLNLEELCIPCGSEHMNCKILLTSRSQDVCTKMNAQSKICVDPLKEDETWILFKQVVGESIDTDVTLREVAMKVAEECGGLPLLVQAVGNALKGKSIDEWKLALNRLKKHEPSDIDPDIKKAYTHLKLSYDYLDSEEVKSCFLMCSMYPDDENIQLDDLVNYGVGLAKFDDLESVNDARERVRNAVTTLTSVGLLWNSEKKEFTKIPDIVRDVALLIASKGNNKFLVEAGKDLSEWLPRNNSLESYTGISLMYNKIRKLPDYELHFPHLNAFLIQKNKLSTISNEFIKGIKEARVLDMSWNNISSLPQSFKLVTKLRMLNLGGNESLYDISILGELKDLEILILFKTRIKKIPQEIGQLVNLRRFDVSNCKNLSHISPGVLLKLCWLEELCIGFYSMHKGIYGSLVEVMKLWKLTYLDLLVPCFDVIPEGFNWEKLNGFLIQIWRNKNHMSCIYTGSISERRLVLSTETLNIPFVKCIKNLIEVNPTIVLRSIENLNNILPDLYHEGFNKLESIRLDDCTYVSCLVDTRVGKTEEMFFTELKQLFLNGLFGLKVLWNCPDKYINLRNLVTVSISRCHKLVRVFSMSVAQGLVSLRELHIDYCDSLKEVIWGGDDDETTNIILFPYLAKISLECLKINSFCSGNSTIIYPSLVEVKIIRCKNMKKWASGIQETPKLKFVDGVRLEYGPNAINDVVVKSSETWKNLHTELSGNRD